MNVDIKSIIDIIILNYFSFPFNFYQIKGFIYINLALILFVLTNIFCCILFYVQCLCLSFINDTNNIHVILMYQYYFFCLPFSFCMILFCCDCIVNFCFQRVEWIIFISFCSWWIDKRDKKCEFHSILLLIFITTFNLSASSITDDCHIWIFMHYKVSRANFVLVSSWILLYLRGRRTNIHNFISR